MEDLALTNTTMEDIIMVVVDQMDVIMEDKIKVQQQMDKLTPCQVVL